MTRVSRWCTLAGITAGLLGLTVPASAATGWTGGHTARLDGRCRAHRVVRPF